MASFVRKALGTFGIHSTATAQQQKSHIAPPITKINPKPFELSENNPDRDSFNINDSKYDWMTEPTPKTAGRRRHKKTNFRKKRRSVRYTRKRCKKRR